MKYGFLILLFLSSVAQAEQYTQYGVEIKRLGSHRAQVFYLTLNEAFKTDCAWGGIYCPVTNENCKNYYSLLIATKLSQKKLGEIRYSQSASGGQCTVDLVAID